MDPVEQQVFSFEDGPANASVSLSDFLLLETEKRMLEEAIVQVEKLHVEQGDVVLLRFDPHDISLTGDIISQYTEYIYAAAQGTITVMPIPQGMSVQKIKADIIRKLIAEVMEDITETFKQTFGDAGITPEMTRDEIRAALEAQDAKDKELGE